MDITPESLLIWAAVTVLGLIIFARRPGAVMTTVYPLVWALWTYSIPGVGKVERLIGIIGIFGYIFIISRKKALGGFTTSAMPIGIFLFILGFLIASMFHPESSALEFWGTMNRLVFLFLAYQLIRTADDINRVAWLYIASSLFACILTLLANIIFGLGYYRFYNGTQMLLDNFGIFAHLAANSNFAVAPAALLFAIYSKYPGKNQRFSIVLIFSFMLLMAFVAQFRRELLIAILMILIFFALDRIANVQRQAWALLFVFSLFFVFILYPNSSVLQDRLQNETGYVLSGTETRIMNFQASVVVFLQNPFGYGSGRYTAAVYSVLGPGYYSWQYYPYNVFSSVAVEGGFISLLGLIIILGSTWVEAIQWRKTSADDPGGWILKAAPALLICILVWFIFGNALDLGLPWFLIGLILSSVRLAQQSQKSD